MVNSQVVVALAMEMEEMETDIVAAMTQVQTL